MDRPVEKLLYSRRDTAEALSLSIRSIDYLITTGRLPARRMGVNASAVRRFAREDHPETVRSRGPRNSVHAGNGQRPSEESIRRFPPQSEGFGSSATFGAKG
jgi:hypothetical protein